MDWMGLLFKMFMGQQGQQGGQNNILGGSDPYYSQTLGQQPNVMGNMQTGVNMYNSFGDNQLNNQPHYNQPSSIFDMGK